MKKMYLWVFAFILLWELIAFGGTFFFTPESLNLKTGLPLFLGAFFVGLFPSLLFIPIYSKQTSPTRKKIVIAGYVFAIPFTLLFATIGPTASELLIDQISPSSQIKDFVLIPLTFILWGTPPLLIGIFLGKLFAPMFDQEEDML